MTGLSHTPPPASPSAHPQDGAASATTSGVTRKYMRGSTLLLGGRAISIVLNLIVQVLTVRYLAKSDYGAFAYALGAASMGSSAILAGLDKGVTRFLPIYHERGDYARTVGTVALAAAIVWGLGVSLIVSVHGLRDVLRGTLVSDPQTLSLLIILVALAPVEAFDTLLMKVVTVSAGARAIFVRRFIVGPVLRLAAVLVVMLSSASVHLLAYGYLLGGVIGVWVYLSILVTTWRGQGILQHLRWKKMIFPTRELLGFTLPLMSSALLVVVRGFLVIALLEYFHNTSAVAEYRAVFPLGKLNAIVLETFAVLFVPVAARMFARNDRNGIAELYWQTAVMTIVLGFPAFALTFSLARPLTPLLFGEHYTSASVLSVIAFGYYFHAAFAFNSLVLRVYGRVRYLVTTDLLALAFAIVSGMLLIPRYGALGAAISTAGTFVVHSLLNQLGLATGGTGIRLLDWRFTRVYATVTAWAILLMAVEVMLKPPIYVGILLAGLVSVVVLRLCRGVLEPAYVFPELLRIPLVRRLIS
jgi:O-antigen/teichoic acid export membrane protein